MFLPRKNWNIQLYNVEFPWTIEIFLVMNPVIRKFGGSSSGCVQQEAHDIVAGQLRRATHHCNVRDEGGKEEVYEVGVSPRVGSCSEQSTYSGASNVESIASSFVMMLFYPYLSRSQPDIPYIDRLVVSCRDSASSPKITPLRSESRTVATDL